MTEVHISTARKTMIKKTEKWMYPIESFVSEFGGALGLFLGFSFLMIWDLLKILIVKACHKYNSNFGHLGPNQATSCNKKNMSMMY